MILKPSKLSLALVLALTSTLATAEPTASYDPAKDALDIFVDLVIVRPVAVAATIAGTGLFLGFSPFTALATIAPPHDAIVRAANSFIGLPACYAFNRPLGTFESQYNPERAKGRTALCSW